MNYFCPCVFDCYKENKYCKIQTKDNNHCWFSILENRNNMGHPEEYIL